MRCCSSRQWSEDHGVPPCPWRWGWRAGQRAQKQTAASGLLFSSPSVLAAELGRSSQARGSSQALWQPATQSTPARGPSWPPLRKQATEPRGERSRPAGPAPRPTPHGASWEAGLICHPWVRAGLEAAWRFAQVHIGPGPGDPKALPQPWQHCPGENQHCTTTQDPKDQAGWWHTQPGRCPGPRAGHSAP